jgi:hypothetical protein
MKILKILLSLVFTLALSSCDVGLDDFGDKVKDISTETLSTLDNAIDALSKESADWQDILNKTTEQLTDEAQATIRNEVSSVLSRSIAKTGVELRCNTDFIRYRVRDALIRIKLKFLNKPVPPVEPKLCNIDPEAIDKESVPKNVKSLNFYGYDFDFAEGLGVFLENENGNRTNVNRYLDKPTHYAMTLKFGGNGVQLDNKSTRFVLQWQNKTISTIGIIQPQTPVCDSEIKRITLNPITYTPPHTRGDAEFKGHGPDIRTSIEFEVHPKHLDARILMNAKETKSDWTTASGVKLYPSIFVPNPGWKIDKIIGNTASTHNYRDSNTTVDRFQLGSGGPAKELLYVGDTNGKEAGSRTKVTVHFNPVRIMLVQDANCVSANALTQMKNVGKISNSVLMRLKPKLNEETMKINRRLQQLPNQ